MNTDSMYFVFGSNLAGIHGAGAALYASKYKGAVWGKGVGFAGNSYAIPTKDIHVITLPLKAIKTFVDVFLDVSMQHLQNGNFRCFQVTRIGCGLAGFTDEQIAPLFQGAPENCYFDEKWKKFLGDKYRYWGTF